MHPSLQGHTELPTEMDECHRLGPASTLTSQARLAGPAQDPGMHGDVGGAPTTLLH